MNQATGALFAPPDLLPGKTSEWVACPNYFLHTFPYFDPSVAILKQIYFTTTKLLFFQQSR